METVSRQEIEVFFNPMSIAVIGATDRPGTWGFFVMMGLTGGAVPGLTKPRERTYKGEIYPVNRRAEKVFGIPAYKDVREISGEVEAAVISVPEEMVEEMIRACGEKGVKGISIITAGFGEAVEGGEQREAAMAELARSYGMRVVGPNVGGAYNLHSGYNTTVTASDTMGAPELKARPVAGICQGGYALFDLQVSAAGRNMGFGKFIQTGNECDLKATDFMEYFADDPEIQVLALYLESIRDVDRFRRAVERIGGGKPIVVYKAGRTEAGARAAKSHTGGMAGDDRLCRALFRQANIIESPTMELLIPLAHAALELPPMKGNRVAIMTYGGSWGVPLTDMLESEGLKVPELSPALQEELHGAGMPERASTRNPVDLGAAGMMALPPETLLGLARSIIRSGEVDALVLHGLGRPVMLNEETMPMKFYFDFETDLMRQFNALQEELRVPVLLGSHYDHRQSQAVHDATRRGIRVYYRLDEIAHVLGRMAAYWRRRNGR